MVSIDVEDASPSSSSTTIRLSGVGAAALALDLALDFFLHFGAGQLLLVNLSGEGIFFLFSSNTRAFSWLGRGGDLSEVDREGLDGPALDGESVAGG